MYSSSTSLDFVFCPAEADKTPRKIDLTAQVALLTDDPLILPLTSVATRTQDPVSPPLLRHLPPGTNLILRHVVASETRGPSRTLGLTQLERGWKPSRTSSQPPSLCHLQIPGTLPHGLDGSTAVEGSENAGKKTFFITWRPASRIMGVCVWLCLRLNHS